MATSTFTNEEATVGLHERAKSLQAKVTAEKMATEQFLQLLPHVSERECQDNLHSCLNARKRNRNGAEQSEQAYCVEILVRGPSDAHGHSAGAAGQ